MKTIIALAAATLLLGACSQEQPTQPPAAQLDPTTVAVSSQMQELAAQGQAARAKQAAEITASLPAKEN